MLRVTLFFIIIACGVSLSYAYQRYQDGSYGPDGDIQCAPDGSFHSGNGTQLYPDGSHGSSGDINLNPNGSYSTGSSSYLRPDGSYGGTRDYDRTPDGRYVDSRPLKGHFSHSPTGGQSPFLA